MRLVALAAAALLLTSAAVAQTPPTASALRALDPENTLVIDTTQGRIVAELSPAAAPGHVARVKELTRRGFYDGIVFHRVIDGFMAQTGDPQGTGEGGSDLPDIAAEFTFRRGPETPFPIVATPQGAEVGFLGALPVVSQPAALAPMTADGKVAAFVRYCPGVLGMARSEPPDSANSQFFFMRASYPALEQRYTAFGRVVAGQDVVAKLKVGEPVVDPDRMTRVRVLADVPEAERPNLRLLALDSPALKARIDAARAAKGADFSICDVDVSGP